MPQIQLLIVEDNPADLNMIQTALSDDPNYSFTFLEADTLKSCKKVLSEADSIDIILLDIGLPDSDGLDTFISVYKEYSYIPIVIMTGLGGEDLGINAIEHGAQDYLVKDQIAPGLLARSIRYAIERNALLLRLNEKEREQEINSIYNLSQAGGSSVTSDAYGVSSISKAFPDLFAELVERYESIIVFAFEQRMLKVDHGIIQKMQEFAEYLGFLKAGPRDVIEIHSEALKNSCKKANIAKSQVYIQEGRILIIKLMGNLVSYYKGRSF